MKRMLLAVIFAIALPLFVYGQQQGTGKTKAPRASQKGVQQQLEKLEEEWGNALVKRDEAALKRILADDYFIIDLSGSTSDKAESIRSTATGALAITAIKFENLKVRVYGNYAIVTGGEVVTMQNRSKQEVKSGFRFTDVFALRRG